MSRLLQRPRDLSREIALDTDNGDAERGRVIALIELVIASLLFFVPEPLSGVCMAGTTVATEQPTAPRHAELTHDGFTVRSNTGTREDLQTELGVEPDPSPSDETHADPAPDAESTKQPGDKLKAGEHHKRISKLTYEREEANRRLEEAQAEMARLKADRERPAREAPRDEPEPRRTEDEQARYERWKTGHDDADPKPEVSKFDDHDAYLDARDAWNERRIDRKLQRASEERQHFERHQQVTKACADFMTRIDTEAQKDPAFREMANKIQIPGEGPIFDVFVLDPSTPVESLVRHFDAHPDELSKLIAMRPGRQLAELHRLLGKLEGRAEAAQAGSVPRVKPSTKAHAPINPVVATHVAATDEPPGDDATDDEWFSYYGKDGKSKR